MLDHAAGYMTPRSLGGQADDLKERNPPLSLQFDVPVEVVEPAFVEVVGGEFAAVFLQLVHARAVRAAVRVHVRLSGGAPALAEIAAGAGGDDVLPGRAPATRARRHVVERQLIAGAAVLAAE